MRKKNTVSSFTLIVGFLCIALVGLALIPFLPLKLSPSYTLPELSVNFQMPGNSARVVEMEVTSKLESVLARIKGIKGINSKSGNGWGRVSLKLDKHANTDVVRFEASTIIRQLWSELPDGVGYPTIRMNTPDGDAARPFLIYTINSQANPIAIRQYAEENIKPRLAGIKGVYQVNVAGATSREWQLEYDSDYLRNLAISPSDIQQAISQYYQKEFLGTVNIKANGNDSQWIRLVLQSENESTFPLDKIYVRNKNERLFRLDQLITAQNVEATPYSYYRINGLNSIYVSITAEQTVNQLSLNREIEKEMSTIKDFLLPGYEIYTGYNAAEYIQDELDKIYFRSGLTILILLLFVLLITGSLKYLILITITLIVNLLVAVVFYYLLGLEMQLYSLAGITISLSLIIDCAIVITDHMLHRHNMKAYVSILAATLTTIGALSVVFFLDEKLRLNLQDFASVVIVNLLVSLIMALFFVPSLIEKLNLRQIQTNKLNRQKSRGRFIFFSKKRMTIRFTKIYGNVISFLLQRRVPVCLLLLLAFGVPIYMIPEKIEKDNFWATLYNNSLGTSFYKESIKPITDKIFGGTLRLFTEKVYDGSYFIGEGETILHINATLPNGSTLSQMNALVGQMEAYLTQFTEIKQFQTNIAGARRASIDVYFTKEHQLSSFPYMLKSNVISKALQLGGGSWGVYGLEGQGFNNDVSEPAGSFRVKLTGYNYDDLYAYAESLKERLLAYRRIKDVVISSEFSYWKDDYREFYFDFDRI